jgi:hypothetical protein
MRDTSGVNFSLIFRRIVWMVCAGAWFCAVRWAQAQEVLVASGALTSVEVRSQQEDLSGVASAASDGVVSGVRVQVLPLLRPAEVLEQVPGLIATQHAGDGKANQYFLRGFNLDHGTDFATSIDGVLVNMPTHAHGQGYTDLNFLIPELVEQVNYRKGPYSAEAGDFSTAGSADVRYARMLGGSLAQITLGPNGYARSLLAGSPTDAHGGQWLYGLELFHNDGPWKVAEDYRKVNGVLRYSEGARDNGYSLTAMAYRGSWTSTDQVPLRAIEGGLVDRYGSLDSTAGGRAQRVSLSGDWAHSESDRQRRAQAWLLQSELDLWSNFTYCASDYDATGTCNSGDQFRQSERRYALGGALSESQVTRWAGRDVVHSYGAQARLDRISPIGLYTTQSRNTLATVREDRVDIDSLGLWGQTEVRWTSHLRSVLGLRADAVALKVNSSLAANSGTASDAQLSPKAALIYAMAPRTELYVNYGHGFHSNDARGATITVDPKDSSTAVDRVRPLVRTRGSEVGLRTEALPGWHSTVALWQLDLDSELVFVGDAGITEASRPSHRQGVEWSNRWYAQRWLAVDADLNWSEARYTDHQAAGDYVPGAAWQTANLGMSVDGVGRWSGALRLRYLGARPLVEDGSVWSEVSCLVNLRVAYRQTARVQWAIEVFNLLDRQGYDIEYWYTSRMVSEAASVDDRHVHPTEPRTLRLTWAYRY